MKRDLDHAFGGGLLFGTILVLFISFVTQPKAEGVGIQMEPLTVRDIYIAAAIGRGETPEQAIKTAERLMILTHRSGR